MSRCTVSTEHASNLSTDFFSSEVAPTNNLSHGSTAIGIYSALMLEERFMCMYITKKYETKHDFLLYQYISVF